MSEKEYNECVSMFADHVYRFILKNVKQEDDAKDIVQSSFEKLWINLEKVDFSRCKSYLFTIAYHQMIDTIRKNKKMTLREEFYDGALVAPQKHTDVKRILNRALDMLSDTQRSLVLLKDYEGYSYEEIAEITALSLSQVKVYLHRARLQLRSYLVKPENVI